MGFIKGWLYCLLWYSSILAGYAGLFCPLLPILFLSNRLYRYCTDVLFTFWQYYPTALLEILCQCEVQVSGDAIQSGETSLLVMNHRTRTDWNFIWPTVYHSTVGNGRYRHPTKFVLKDIIRHIPGPGWVMQLACFVYIKRCWLVDQKTFKKMINYFSSLGYKYSLLVFPEGTDFTPTTQMKSHHYAEKHNLKKYEHVLHPRTTGFVFLTQQLLACNDLDAIYDMTLVYPDVVPQNEKLLLCGYFPKQVKMHLTRYPSSVLPKTVEGLKGFLEERWSEKEQILKEFDVTGHFLHGKILRRCRPFELYAALAFWTLLPYAVCYLFATIIWFRHLVIAHTLFLITVNITSDGFQKFEATVCGFKAKIFGRPF